ncbi:hypothetical protein P8452_29809 [Trifolium repens]|nr:hypothetical protein P8452_29809 [Trifolium repens]
MPRLRPVSSDHETTPFEEGEEPIERLAEPCAINSFDIDQHNPLAAISVHFSNEMKSSDIVKKFLDLIKDPKVEEAAEETYFGDISSPETSSAEVLKCQCVCKRVKKVEGSH